jgi:hypothetical protein
MQRNTESSRDRNDQDAAGVKDNVHKTIKDKRIHCEAKQHIRISEVAPITLATTSYRSIYYNCTYSRVHKCAHKIKADSQRNP